MKFLQNVIMHYRRDTRMYFNNLELQIFKSNIDIPAPYLFVYSNSITTI